jgi:hypothetical protein
MKYDVGCARLALAAILAIAISNSSRAADANSATDDSGSNSPIADYFANWFARVDKAQAEQPHWMTPLVTVTPRLEEEVRYDQFWTGLNGGKSTITNYDGGKGLELIPTETNEIIFGVPAFEQKSAGKSSATGWSDYPFFLVKQRLLTGNEQNGNYIVTAFLQGSAPTGDAAFTNNAYTITPTIAGGFGYGLFDVQATLSELFPTSHESTIGRPITYNIAFQANVANLFWPELEINGTHFVDGAHSGVNQVFLLPGVILGRLQIYERLKFSIGFGRQIAVTSEHPTEINNWVLSARASF